MGEWEDRDGGILVAFGGRGAGELMAFVHSSEAYP